MPDGLGERYAGAVDDRPPRQDRASAPFPPHGHARGARRLRYDPAPPEARGARDRDRQVVRDRSERDAVARIGVERRQQLVEPAWRDEQAVLDQHEHGRAPHCVEAGERGVPRAAAEDQQVGSRHRVSTQARERRGVGIASGRHMDADACAAHVWTLSRA